MKRVTVLLSTYNGERYLKEQLDSIINQTNVDVFVLVRDDGSSDSTLDILEEYKKTGKLTYYTGSNLKPAKSFMDLVNQVDNESDYYAFSDQDDYWLPEKLSKAIHCLEQFKTAEPSLYSCEMTLVDENLLPIRKTSRNPAMTVEQAVMVSGAAGCTMCFNKALLEELKKVDFDYQIMHDNLVYKICVFIGGNIYHDDDSYIFYRQHNNNVIGGLNKENTFKRHLREIQKNKCYRSNAIRNIYYKYEKQITPKHKWVLLQICNYKKVGNNIRILFNRNYKTGNKKNDLYFKLGILSRTF